MFKERDAGFTNVVGVGDALSVRLGDGIPDPTEEISEQKTRMTTEVHFKKHASVYIVDGNVKALPMCRPCGCLKSCSRRGRVNYLQLLILYVKHSHLITYILHQCNPVPVWRETPILEISGVTDSRNFFSTAFPASLRCRFSGPLFPNTHLSQINDQWSLLGGTFGRDAME